MAGYRQNPSYRILDSICVCIPTNKVDNFPLLTQLLVELNAIVEESDIGTIFTLGDCNAGTFSISTPKLIVWREFLGWQAIGLSSNALYIC